METMLTCKLCGRTNDTVEPTIGACRDCAKALVVELARRKIDVVGYDLMVEYKTRQLTLSLFDGRKVLDASASDEMMAFADEIAKYFRKVHLFITDGKYAQLCSLREANVGKSNALAYARGKMESVATEVEARTQELAELEDKLRKKKDEVAQLNGEADVLKEALNKARAEIGL